MKCTPTLTVVDALADFPEGVLDSMCESDNQKVKADSVEPNFDDKLCTNRPNDFPNVCKIPDPVAG